MRITFILPELSLSGGVKIVAGYAKRLYDRGHHITVVYTPAKPISLKDHVRSWLLGNRSQDWCQGGRVFFENTHFECRMIDRFRPVTDSDVPDADVIVATWWETAEWVAKLSPEKGAKAYFLQHYEIWGGDPRRVDATWRAPLHKIVISRWLADLAVEKFSDKNCSLVPNAIDLDQFHAAPREKNAIPTVGFIYSDVPFKGCDIALAAVELIRQKFPVLRVKCFGGEELKQNLPLPAGGEFTKAPPQDKIREIYSACDAWIVASRSEGFGLPVLEAMACRTPVVATPAGAAPELLADGGGILVEPDNPESLAAGVCRMLESPPQIWRQYSDQAFLTASNHTWDKSVNKMEQALQKTISESFSMAMPDISDVYERKKVLSTV